MSTLYLVSTPIGNLEDMSARAVRILGEVSLIAAEDTRHSGKLLKHFGIDTPMTSYYDHNKGSKTEYVLGKLAADDIALISDAGTPGLNDPGYELVKAAWEIGHTVVPIPGPSAPIAALVSSGLPTDQFLYSGYLPRKGTDRKNALRKVAHLPYTLIFFETPHRLADSLADLLEVLGDRNAAAACELTKMYENIFRGRLSECVQHFQDFPARGEFTLVIEGADDENQVWTEEEIIAAIHQRLALKEKPSNIAKELALISGEKKKKIYNLILLVQRDLS